MTEKKKCVRMARMFRNGELCKEPLDSDEYRDIRLGILRQPCKCGALGDVLIAADIDADKKVALRWELPFIQNDVDTAMCQNQKRVWRDVRYCPFCGRLLPVITEGKL